MTTKTCKVCTKPATLHTAGNAPVFFCDQACASRIGQPYEMRPKSVYHDVIDSNHPLCGFIKHNTWLAECFGELRADGSVKVINKAAVQPLINYLLIGPKREIDVTDIDTIDLRDPSQFEETDKGIVSLFEKMAVLSTPSDPAKRKADEEEEKRKSQPQYSEKDESYIWEVPIEVVSEILFAVVGYDFKQVTPEFEKTIYNFAQKQTEFRSYLSKLTWDQRKKVAFSIIKKDSVVIPEISYYHKARRELLVLGSLNRLWHVHNGADGKFWDMQEDTTGNTLMHYAVMKNFPNLVRSMYIYGASDNIPNVMGKTARDIAVYLNRQAMMQYP